MSAVDLGRNLRYLRHNHDPPLSQERVARNLKISRSRYTHYELGQRAPPVELVLEMARYFHVTMDALVEAPLWKGSGNEIEDFSQEN